MASSAIEPPPQQQQQGQSYRSSGSYEQGSAGDGEAQEDEEEAVLPTPAPGQERVPAPIASKPAASQGQKLRVRRSTFVPGWAVPPRVLLVDDDAVSRKLSSKFLQVFGCTTDVAVDGVSAVNKMNLEKYDLVLMDIVMPKLDGVSATSLIRKFDHMTPIISMTSNSKPNEIMTYYSSGMNDILPKPFTKDGLLEMLEKHLMHLKVFQQMSRVSRPIGIPPLNDAGFEQALTTNAANALVPSGVAPSSGSFGFGASDDEGRINPLAGMGLTDEQYNMILQNIVNGEGFMGGMTGIEGMSSGAEKRPLDDSSDSRDSKRSRFEIVD
ncbi:CheY-like superfamily [Cyathus striatus]|nr:CheY-like superfamily [Cyathus striatus]